MRDAIASGTGDAVDHRIRLRLARSIVQAALRAMRLAFDDSPALLDQAVADVLDRGVGKLHAAAGLCRAAVATLQPGDYSAADS